VIKPAIYKGIIRHRRFSPISHQFKYQITMVMLDLDSIARDLHYPPLLGTKQPALGWFRRADYVGDPTTDLKNYVLDQVENSSGARPDGKVMLLTHLRYWGFVMNPISIFYCYDQNDRLDSVALQVTNTPWREKVLYVIPVNMTNRTHVSRFAKLMHVSPFNPMQMEYLVRLQTPGGRLFFHLENQANGKRVTDATMVFERHPLSVKKLIGLTLRQPSMTLKVGLGIYWQALRLWIKKSPIYTHP
jgi:DUF1365 family protein